MMCRAHCKEATTLFSCRGLLQEDTHLPQNVICLLSLGQGSYNTHFLFLASCGTMAIILVLSFDSRGENSDKSEIPQFCFVFWLKQFVVTNK